MALIKIQARFLDEKVFNDIKEDCHKYGVFKREPDLGRFLVSEVGQAAGHKIQYAFEKDHDEQKCRDLITEYTQCGGDNGLTLRHMRQACGLRRISGDKAETPALATIVPSQEQDDAPHRDDVDCEAAAKYFIGVAAERCFASMTYTYYMQIPWPSALKLDISRAALWESFKESKRWMILGAKGRAKEAMVPRILTQRGYPDLFNSNKDGAADVVMSEETRGSTECQEEIVLSPTAVARMTDIVRNENLDVLIEALKMIPKKRGPRSQSVIAGVDDKVTSLQSVATLIADVRCECGLAAPPVSQTDSVAGVERKKRRIKRKMSVTDTWSHLVTYRWRHDWRGRRYAQGVTAAQHMDQRVQTVLLGQTVELAIDNCTLVLLSQMVFSLLTLLRL